MTRVSMPSHRRSLRTRLLALAVLLPLAGAVMGQQKIEQQMTPEQFKATGLDRLDPQELANLNAWLEGKLQVETEKAAEVARQETAEERRGLFARESREPVVAALDGEFKGFGRGRSYLLDNGQVWQQIDDATLVIDAKTSPKVRITPSLIGQSWYLSIEGYNTRAQVQRVK